MGRYDSDMGMFTASEFKNRGVIKLAPDALVYINGRSETAVLVPISAGKTQGMDFQYGITGISVQNNIDPPGSSTASIEIAAPIYNSKNSNYWIDWPGEDRPSYKRPYFTPMLEIQIYFRGRYLVRGAPQYYPAFWGFITNVDESFNGGIFKINISCADMLHWWSYVQIAFRPSVQSNIFAQGLQGLTAYGSRYETANPYEVIYSLVQDMGLQNFITPDWLAKLSPNAKTPVVDSRFVEIFKRTSEYWNQRFADVANLLRMYGATGYLIKNPKKPLVPEEIINQGGKSTDPSPQATKSNYNIPFGLEDRLVAEFQVFHEFADMGKNLAEAEYMTKLDVAIEVKNRVDYEFFQDVNGNFIFKPPFYNMNTRNILPYNVAPQDIISFNNEINSEEIVTALQVQVSPQQNIRDSAWINQVGFHVDLALVSQYGYRHKKIDSWWLSESSLAQSYAVGKMGVMNAKAYTGSLTVPGRPEVRLGYPIYVEHKDCFYYVKSINHSFDFGGSYTTTFSLETERRREVDDQGVILKDKIYKYVSPGDDSKLKQQITTLETAIASKNKAITDLKVKRIQLQEAEEKKEQKTITSLKKEVNAAEKQKILSTNPEDDLNKLLTESGILQSMKAGVYAFVNRETNSQQSITPYTYPYTDEWGYKVIGAFRYGRNLVAQPGKSLDDFVTKNEDPKRIVNVSDAINLLGIEIGSGKENKIMSDYFAANTQASVEGIVNPFANIPTQDTNVAAQSMVNMVLKGMGETPLKPLVGNVYAQERPQ